MKRVPSQIASDCHHGPGLAARCAIAMVRVYQQAISPWLGQRCRFHPSCSQYCIDALGQHGMVLGLWLGIKRICKCHPFHPGGYDPVPKPITALPKRDANEE